MTDRRRDPPIFHLSVPVRDLEEGLSYYARTFGGVPGRRAQAWADIALFGAQLTLQQVPGDLLDPMPRSRHFGATLSWSEWEALIGTLSDFVEPPRIDHQGTQGEQAKAMVQDPSGNLIELKAYRQPAAILGGLAGGPRQ